MRRLAVEVWAGGPLVQKPNVGLPGLFDLGRGMKVWTDGQGDGMRWKMRAREAEGFIDALILAALPFDPYL